MESLPRHPLGGSVTGEYFENADGSVKVPAVMMSKEMYPKVKQDLATYKWVDSDFLLATYPKNGTHFMWEVMTMLQRGSADHIKDSKAVLMVDAFPISQTGEIFPSPRVLNTHYRTDVLPSEFRKAKTVIVMRNPKDVCVSGFYHETKITPSMAPEQAELASLTFSDFVKRCLFDKDIPYGSYFDYTAYMWTLRDDPNHLVVFYEDLKVEPVATIQKVNEFMGTNASPELVQQIADATSFDKMKNAKTKHNLGKGLQNMLESQNKERFTSETMTNVTAMLYRKGGIGDWKNHFTVADNEMFDEFLANWEGGKDIPFKYTQS